MSMFVVSVVATAFALSIATRAAPWFLKDRCALLAMALAARAGGIALV